MKLAIISVALPPSQSGQSIAIYQLLKRHPPDSYCLITHQNITIDRAQHNCVDKLSARYYFLSPADQILQIIIRVFLLCKIDYILKLILNVRVRQIEKILLEEKVEAVITCTADLFDPPAALIASKKLGIPYIFYAFDYYSQQWTNSVFQAFAESYEREIVLSAKAIIVPNECMCKEYQKQYNVLPTIIHNSFDIEEYELNAQITPKILPGELKIVYTGAIYEAHYSAFRNIIAAIKIIDNPHLKLHLYTSQSSVLLGMNGIVGPVVFHQHLPNKNIAGVQRNADILLLPLAFNSIYPKIIKTSSPGKIGEYLASKRPILVHAPKYSFVSWYFKKYNCGLVIDLESPELLVQAIERLITDKKICREITQYAYERAIIDFDTNAARKKFLTLVNGVAE